MVNPWVVCLWAAWAAAAVHVIVANMVLKALTLDTQLLTLTVTATRASSGSGSARNSNKLAANI